MTPGDWIAAAGFGLSICSVIYGAGRIAGKLSDLAADVEALTGRVGRIESILMRHRRQLED